ncbi:MAG: hypothetical protein KatS3mg127_0127 [Silanimonas sp.]|nr:MAG: hypothetical protein KatS3mg127_0127 [Silanimonas sp.]
MALPFARRLLTGLYLLLALVLVLQSTTALALRQAMPLAPVAGAVAALETGQAGPETAPSLPCHVALATAMTPTEAPPLSDVGDCCDGGGLCQWACAMAPMAPVAELRLAPAEAAPEALPVSHPAAPRWPVTQPLRPPIA